MCPLLCVRYRVYCVFLIFSCMSQSAWTWSKFRTRSDRSQRASASSVKRGDGTDSPDVRLTTAEDHKTVKQFNETTGDRGGAGTTAFASRRTIGKWAQKLKRLEHSTYCCANNRKPNRIRVVRTLEARRARASKSSCSHICAAGRPAGPLPEARPEEPSSRERAGGGRAHIRPCTYGSNDPASGNGGASSGES